MKHLVLVGGGHSHAIMLRLLGLQPIPNLSVTLLTDVTHAPYSGMLPGYIAGFYQFNDCHINLPHLAEFARVRQILDRAIGLDIYNKQVLCEDHLPIVYDWLSIDVGSTPDTTSIEGAMYTMPAKPVPQFLAAWTQFLSIVEREEGIPGDRPLRLGIVGGGAGGIELALNMQAHLRKILDAKHLSTSQLEVHLFHRSENLMTGYPVSVGQCFQTLLQQRGIYLHLAEAVEKITLISDFHHSSSIDLAQGTRSVQCRSGLAVDCDRVVWVTQASAPQWLQTSGLATDEQGFILVNDHLQSVSHPDIFATGDVATMHHHSRPKAGVFAVRQGGPLFKNLRHAVSGELLQPFYPQKRHLALIGTGEGQAVAVWGKCYLGPSTPLWYWKDWIDRQFMQQFSSLSQS